MKPRWPKPILLTAALWSAWTAGAADARFSAVDVYLDSAAPVAAWQFEFGAAGDGMKVVGVENGDSAAFQGTPYYDREAVQAGTAERIIVADYSLAEAAELPSGRTRIATLHLMLEGPAGDDLRLRLVKAVGPAGNPVEVSIELQPSTGDDP